MSERDLEPAVPIPIWLLAAALTGAIAALLGGYWDDAWHTERGRDDFFIAPHIAIYLGVASAGAALAAWALLNVRAGGLRAALRYPPLALALLSVGVTLASGPIDNAWHVAFGRDSVIWSPPHMLGIAGTFGLASALLLEVRGRRPVLALFACGGVVAAAAFTVIEYDTDVPQFDALWYVPVLALATSLAFVVVRLGTGRPWAATEAAAAHLGLILAVSAFLLLVGFDAPALPLLVPAAAILDPSFERRWPTLPRAAAFVAILYAAYAIGRNWLGEGVELTAGDLLLGAPVALLASWLVLQAGEGGDRQPSPRSGAKVTAVALILLGALSLPAIAIAHDPGQGEDAGDIALTINVNDRAASVFAQPPPERCYDTQPRGLVARRAGEDIRAPLTKSGCAFRGRLELPNRGRWFVYVELTQAGEDVETWLPVTAGDGNRRVADGARYAYKPSNANASALKVLTGIVLYVLVAALIASVLLLARRLPHAT